MSTSAIPDMASRFIEADGLSSGLGAKSSPGAQAIEKFDRLLGTGAESAPPDSAARVSAAVGVDHYVVPPATFSQSLIPERLARFSTEASHKLRAAIESPGVKIAPEIAERYPELELMNQMSMDVREFMVAEIEFRFVNKTVESTEKNVQTLFRQQG